ncbi:unnamed protein product [Durusdinium trenchii]|uniref:Uncharacterized protein n=1 Tax=Durusdinium trenchii TaxID=1381693 RepID=A0ABP0P5U6_9DINO
MRARKLEFGICGLDITYPRDRLGKLFQRPDACRVEPVAAFQLAYQGFPWERAVGYRDSDVTLEGRRYPGGETYPSWREIEEMITAMPAGTKLSYHLNETQDWKYVSWLLTGDERMERLISFLCENDRFKARHIQINVSARGVDPTLFSVGEGTLSSETVVKLAARYPETIFLLSVFERDGVTSWPWVRQTLDLSRGARAASATHARTLQNLAAFFDDSGGLGIQPTEVPEIPVGYPRGVGQPIGFTGGIVAENVKSWLSRYEERAQEAECWCISDAQSGFRVEHSRSKPIDAEKLEDMVKRIYEYGAETGDRTLQDLREEAQKKLETLDESELLEFVTNSTEKQDSLTFSASMGYGDSAVLAPGAALEDSAGSGPTSRGGSRQEFQRDLDQVEAKFRSTLGTEGLTRQRWMMLLMKAGCASQDAKALLKDYEDSHSISVRSFFYLLRGKVADPEASV